MCIFRVTSSSSGVHIETCESYLVIYIFKFELLFINSTTLGKKNIFNLKLGIFIKKKKKAKLWRQGLQKSLVYGGCKENVFFGIY